MTEFYLIGLFVVLMTFNIVFFIWQKKKNDIYVEQVNKVWGKIAIIQRDVSALCTSGLGVDERVVSSERRVRKILERLDELEEHDSHEYLQEFQGAVKLAQEGSDVDEIVERCNLTVDEAKLLISLHKS